MPPRAATLLVRTQVRNHLVGVALASLECFPRWRFESLDSTEGPGGTSSGLQTWCVWMPFQVVDKSSSHIGVALVNHP